MIELKIENQPDDETCGPTSLHSIYKYYDHPLTLDQIINTVDRSLSGGTLASLLGKHALGEGFKTTLYVNNLNFFDPTWFEDGIGSPSVLKRKLSAQSKFKRSKDFLYATKSYCDFLDAGGEIRFQTLDVKLLKHFFDQGIPILTGLSATYLYGSARERFAAGRSYYDDVRGLPCGHFVVLCGFDNERYTKIIVADPHRENPLSHDNYYKVDSHRLINAIMLGVLTFDANLLIIERRDC